MNLLTLLTLDGIGGRAVGIVALLAVASGSWWLARRRAARFRTVPTTTDPDGSQLTREHLGADLGTTATFVQFSAATCATCPQVHRLLVDVAASEPGVAHVEILAEDHMDLVRRFSVFRTPTVLLLDPLGSVVARMSGPLTRLRALAALAEATTDTTPTPRSIHA